MNQRSGIRADALLFAASDRVMWRALVVLSSAESLTDPVAEDLLTLVGLPPAAAAPFVDAIHTCDFVVERNSEWHLSPQVRTDLLNELMSEPELSLRAHSRLLEIGSRASNDDYRHEVPLYLVGRAGRAYHGMFVADPNALGEYAAVADAPQNGQQWLAGRLAAEQVKLGVLSGEALEVNYLRGMILYREGKIRESEPLLRSVATSGERRREVAVAAHLVGRLDGRQYRFRKRGEGLLWDSLSINEELGLETRISQVLHTLGQLVGRDQKRADEAEELLRRSLEIKETLDDRLGTAKVLHTLGQLIGRSRRRTDEAEELLRRSLEIKEEVGFESDLAEVLHTLGQLIGRNRKRTDEAEELLRRSLEIKEAVYDRLGIAQVLHTLGRLIAEDAQRSDEARLLLERSSALGKAIDNLNHQAQVLYSLSLLSNVSEPEAHDFLERSLALNRRIGNREGERIVLAALKRRRGGSN